MEIGGENENFLVKVKADTVVKYYILIAYIINSRSLIDKNFQKEKRRYFRILKEKQRYLRKQQVNTDNLNSANPNQFWEEIDKLKPMEIPKEVYDETGDIVTDPRYVIKQ